MLDTLWRVGLGTMMTITCVCYGCSPRAVNRDAHRFTYFLVFTCFFIALNTHHTGPVSIPQSRELQAWASAFVFITRGSKTVTTSGPCLCLHHLFLGYRLVVTGFAGVQDRSGLCELLSIILNNHHVIVRQLSPCSEDLQEPSCDHQDDALPIFATLQ